MEIKLVIVLCILTVFSVFALEKSSYELKQVLILSRHNVRTPLAKDLDDVTPKPWPKWKEKNGYLTEKGAKLEGFMGEFFCLWLNNTGLLPSCNCPNEEDFYVYANTKQRTMASAKAFVKNAFPNCNVTIHYNATEKTDPVFEPVIHNNTEIFKKMALEQMEAILKSVHLNSSYEEIDNILDFKESKICTDTNKCDLATDKNKIYGVKAGYKPNIVGPLKIAKSAIDAFIMENYQGFPENDVAWGELENDMKWKKIMPISRAYHNIIFNTTLIAQDISKPLVKYMSKIFIDASPKVALLMGHDSNMYTVLKGMNFKPYTLKNQYEITPAGGKIVFQRWYNKEKKEDYLKIDYVYSTVRQMRNGLKLSLEHPPEFTLLELEGCETDKNGYCRWSDFVNLLKNL